MYFSLTLAHTSTLKQRANRIRERASEQAIAQMNEWTQQTNELNDQPCRADRDNRAAQDTNVQKTTTSRKLWVCFFVVIFLSSSALCRVVVCLSLLLDAECVCVLCRSLCYYMCRFFQCTRAAAVAVTSTCSAAQLSRIYFGSLHHTLTLCAFCICDCPSHDLLCISVSFNRGGIARPTKQPHMPCTIYYIAVMCECARSPCFIWRLSRWQYNKTIYVHRKWPILLCLSSKKTHQLF